MDASARACKGPAMIAPALAALAAALAPATTLETASASLSGPSCTGFRWVASDSGARGAITVPVALDGRALWMQLDTGADVTSLYGPPPAGTPGGAETFRATTLTIAGTTLDRPTLHANRDMTPDAQSQGTLGLSALLGRVVVIDYPAQRFCLFAAADVPAPIAAAPAVRAMLRNAKFHVPVTIGTFDSDTIVFDTGSSELPLNVDLALWRRLTGRATTSGAPASYRASAWGKPLVIPGAPSTAPLRVGATDLGRVTVFTNPLAPAGFADWPVKTDGVLGNAPVWDGIVVMDLTARMRFAIIR
jgi:hypothetical protein